MDGWRKTSKSLDRTIDDSLRYPLSLTYEPVDVFSNMLDDQITPKADSQCIAKVLPIFTLDSKHGEHVLLTAKTRGLASKAWAIFYSAIFKRWRKIGQLGRVY